MPHKLRAMKDKTKECRRSSIILSVAPVAPRDLERCNHGGSSLCAMAARPMPRLCGAVEREFRWIFLLLFHRQVDWSQTYEGHLRSMSDMVFPPLGNVSLAPGVLLQICGYLCYGLCEPYQGFLQFCEVVS